MTRSPSADPANLAHAFNGPPADALPIHRIDARSPSTCSAWPLFDVATTRQLEQAAASALPPHTLMQRAGLACARLAMALAPHARQIWIACGPGNNGGDGLEAAMHLARWGRPVSVTLLADPDRLPADAHASWQRAVAAGVRFVEAMPPLTAQDLCIDALLGIGSARTIDADSAIGQTLAAIDASPATVLAIDVPTGLDADTGALRYTTPQRAKIAIKNIAIFAPTASPRHTLSLLTLKPGLFTAHGRDVAGSVWFCDLGVSSNDASPSARLQPSPAPALQRLHASHKGTFGDVVVIGGQGADGHGRASMQGAAILAATAALHGGAGRVSLCLLSGDDPTTPHPIPPDIMLRDPATVSLANATVVCGCGGGEAVAAVLPRVLAEAQRLVLDADALNAIAADAALQSAFMQRQSRHRPTVLTPHPLEAARLLGSTATAVQANRLAAARQLADQLGCVVVLKGSGTVIAAPGQVSRINASGNARLAIGGTGDVLAGFLGAVWSSTGEDSLAFAFEASARAVATHGPAADAWPPNQTLTASALAQVLTTG